MENTKLEKRLHKTWKQLLQANIQHNEALASSLMKEMIALEIEQKKRRH
ncbi:hypothetical protein THMIRHAM_15550 [Thiomicrorhabdus immobilis]|uniref:Uncharacterized protein n=1 Tax=Thiomicrorhabdus immobilis TaxID=2791037 RepID=A0ABM7MEE7_9GAMM|nr:hypothetical protein [Thiomicrorhabdus immobilis]BCN93770.1 hypothetical protein THMIRHAM_15550 [Thiomicrorhabdus immobilis]